VTGLQELLDEVTADEAGGAGDESFHADSSFFSPHVTAASQNPQMSTTVL